MVQETSYHILQNGTASQFLAQHRTPRDVSTLRQAGPARRRRWAARQMNQKQLAEMTVTAQSTFPDILNGGVSVSLHVQLRRIEARCAELSGMERHVARDAL